MALLQLVLYAKKKLKIYYLFGMRPVGWPVAGTTFTRPLPGHWTWAEPRILGVRRSAGPKGRLKVGKGELVFHCWLG
jgi:hypothetical protein